MAKTRRTLRLKDEDMKLRFAEMDEWVGEWLDENYSGGESKKEFRTWRAEMLGLDEHYAWDDPQQVAEGLLLEPLLEDLGLWAPGLLIETISEDLDRTTLLLRIGNGMARPVAAQLVVTEWSEVEPTLESLIELVRPYFRVADRLLGSKVVAKV